MELPDDKAFAGSNVQAMQSLAAFAGSLSATRHQTCTASTVCVWLCALLSGQGRPPFVDVQMLGRRSDARLGLSAASGTKPLL